MINVLGLSNLTSGKFKSFLHLSGIRSMYLIESYEKYPDINEHIGGRFLGVSNLNSSITFSNILFGLPLSFVFLLFFIR